MSSDLREYKLLDSGDGRKLERFGPYVLERPCAQAVWRPRRPPETWRAADAAFTRDPDNRWEFRRRLPATWEVSVDDLIFEIGPTDFGHIGVFPEHARAWRWVRELGRRVPSPAELAVLNLFAYSGGATLAAARAGMAVCHLDASKKMVEQARRNAALNGLDARPVRWIVDDVRKFLSRETRRERRYAGVILDPPSFGRGRRQELFKIDDHLLEVLDLCAKVLDPSAHFVFFSCHTPGFTPLVVEHLLRQHFGAGRFEGGEMVLAGEPGVLDVPSGCYGVLSTFGVGEST